MDDRRAVNAHSLQTPTPPGIGGVVPSWCPYQQDLGTRLSLGLILPDVPETRELIGVTVSDRLGGALTDGVDLMGTRALTGKATLDIGDVYF